MNIALVSREALPNRLTLPRLSSLARTGEIQGSYRDLHSACPTPVALTGHIDLEGTGSDYSDGGVAELGWRRRFFRFDPPIPSGECRHDD